METAGGGVWTHGEAVAIGIVAATYLGERLGVTEPGVGDRVSASLAALGLPTLADADVDANRVMEALRHDKKRVEGAVHVVLPVRPGEVRIEAIDDSTVRAWVEATIR